MAVKLSAFAVALISQIYFRNKTSHVSDSSCVHHQEFFTVYTAMVYVILKFHKWVKLLMYICVYIVVKIVKHFVHEILCYIKK